MGKVVLVLRLSGQFLYFFMKDILNVKNRNKNIIKPKVTLNQIFSQTKSSK